MKTIKHSHQDAYGRWVLTLSNHEEVVNTDLHKATELASKICDGSVQLMVGRTVRPALLQNQVS